MKLSLVFPVTACVLLGATVVPASDTTNPVWQKQTTGWDHPRIHSVCEGSSGIVVASSGSLYQQGEDNQFFRLPASGGLGGKIQDLWCEEEGSLLAATSEGLYRIATETREIKRLFRPSDEKARDCRFVRKVGGDIYVGTARGVWRSRKGHSEWEDLFGQRAGEVWNMGTGGEFIYGIYHDHMVVLDARSGKIRDVSLPFIAGRSDDEDESKVRPALYVLGAEDVMLCIRGYIYRWGPEQNWRLSIRTPVPAEGVTSILPPLPNMMDSPFLAATDRGIYVYRHERWTPLNQGLESYRVNALVRMQDRIWAGTDNGLYVMDPQASRTVLRNVSVSRLASESAEPYDGKLSHEPSIAEVHRLAIAYADVHPEKVIRWQRQARMRAWIPDVDIGVDGGRGWSRSDSLWGSSSSGGTHYNGPDDKSSSSDVGWDISLSWDLADLVWSSDQTSIDSRAKLMIELREDILNQITRLYFERKRIQRELTVTDLDPSARWERELRIAELTALIDALTGGDFSRLLTRERATESKHQ